jgi:hypothetical protein
MTFTGAEGAGFQDLFEDVYFCSEFALSQMGVSSPESFLRFPGSLHDSNLTAESVIRKVRSDSKKKALFCMFLRFFSGV